MPPSRFKKTPSGPRVLYWFRTDLRLHDSPALTHALSLNPSVLIPLWTWDPHYVYRQRGSVNRWNFLVECMSDLSASLGKLNAKQKLHVVRAAPGKVLPLLLKHWKIDALVFERDTDAYARIRDREVTEAAEELGVKVVSVPGRTLFDSEEVVEKNGGKPTMSMAQLLKAVDKIEGGGMPKRPVESPKSLPDPLDTTEMDISGLEQALSVDERKEQANPGWPRVEGLDYNAVQRTGNQDGAEQYSAGLMGPNRDFGVPTLEEMGFDPTSVTSPHRGGETAGLQLLAQHVANEEYIATFEKPATAPTAFDPPATTVLSPHMHFGSVSCRKFFWDVQDVVDKRQKQKKHVSKQPVNIAGQLLFRDMYFAAHCAVGIQFGQTYGNPVARFVPWHLQSRHEVAEDGQVVSDGTYVVDDPKAEEYFQRWKHGRTGFPWIDALMRQLKQEGWIHHLGRHAVACFLTRGGCYVSWERGAEVFEEWLVDHEVACNAGNWMWLSCVAFFSQFFRCYSPITFPKKWDAEGEFVRRYVPELAKFDKKFIYEPHRAPIADQKAWGCVIKGDGKDGSKQGDYHVYPKPMFDFNERRQFCIDAMKKAYDVGLYGDNEKVIRGEWKKVFDFNSADGVSKEEANDFVTRGEKRGRMNGEDGHQDDMGEEAHIGDESHDDRPGKRKAAKKQSDKKGKQQGTLDSMVSRGRTKK
jgi:cryptochrome